VGEICGAIELHPKPVVAALNGPTVAGGFDLAIACDFILAVEDAFVADGHARGGFTPGGGATVRLPLIIGKSRALFMMLTGRPVPARTLERWGLLHRVVENQGLLEAAVHELGDDLDGASPCAVAAVKELVRSAYDEPLTEALITERRACHRDFLGPSAKEGIAAFLERREPVFPNP
jgi:enoyl-CoA hydratase/carnithine racemase